MPPREQTSDVNALADITVAWSTINVRTQSCTYSRAISTMTYPGAILPVSTVANIADPVWPHNNRAARNMQQNTRQGRAWPALRSARGAVIRVAIAGALLALAPVNTQAAEPRSGLPYAQGKSFATLDAYLKHLESLGPIGVPFYRELSPGRYERQTSIRLPGEKPQTQSRAELARQFGFPIRKPLWRKRP